jgi:cytochrome c peroxidase
MIASAVGSQVPASTSTRLRRLLLGLSALGCVVLLYGWLRPKPTPAEVVKTRFLLDISQADSAMSQLQQRIRTHQPVLAVQAAFRRTRLAYKRVEFLSAYYSPETTRALNGPNLPDVDDDLRVNAPEGFQVLEELLFPTFATSQQATVLQTVAVMRANLRRLRLMSETNELTDSHIFDAIRLEVFRVITQGITGFDSPVALHSLPEAVSVLIALRQQIAPYELAQTDAALARRLDNAFAGAIGRLQGVSTHKPTFDNFDRLAFIKNHANVLSSLLFDAQKALSIPVFTESRLLSPSAQTLTEAGVFNPAHFIDADEHRPTPDRVALGRQLFYDPILSGNGQRSCATCHQPNRAFTDGETTSLAINNPKNSLGRDMATTRQRVGRNAPTLLNSAFQAVQFMDSRVVFLEDQASDVIRNAAEMHGSLPVAVQALQQRPDYRQRFGKAYARGITEQTLKNALASYVRSLVSLDSRVDQYIRNQHQIQQQPLLTTDEKLGFNLFMGKGKCATCHFFPLFNGTVPPAYQKTESEVLGTPAIASEKQLDPDVGKFVLTQREPHRYAFKTPTLRHIARTAPYMHNGVYKTLDEVIDFYEKGGGTGLGFDLENQTLPGDKLNLTPAEKRALVAFLKAL